MSDAYYVVCRMVTKSTWERKFYYEQSWSISGPFTERKTAERATINAMKREGTISARIANRKTLYKLRSTDDPTLKSEILKTIMLTYEGYHD